MRHVGLLLRKDRRTDRSGSGSDATASAVVHSLDLERAARIVARQPRARAALALLGDKEFIFSGSGDAFLMYRRSGRCYVAMGDPVGPEREWRELIEHFDTMAKADGGWPVFYQVEQRAISSYRDQGLSCVKLGEEASISLPKFSMDGSNRRRLRQTLRRTERGGGSVEVVPAKSVSAVLEELREVSDSWLAEKNTREKGFSLGAFEPRYLTRCPIAIVRQHERIVAFANLWCGEVGGELGLDLMRYSPEAPYGVMEYLFVKLFEWGREQGYAQFSLGMAPLAGLENDAPNSIWVRAGAALYRHGEYFYNFRGVREYKAKFLPEWESRYLASPGGVRLPLTLAAVGSLIAGGVRGLMAR